PNYSRSSPSRNRTARCSLTTPPPRFIPKDGQVPTYRSIATASMTFTPSRPNTSASSRVGRCCFRRHRNWMVES
ncbi:MAG: hypothetical protein ACK56I_11520, partial [bacterium]